MINSRNSLAPKGQPHHEMHTEPRITGRKSGLPSGLRLNHSSGATGTMVGCAGDAVGVAGRAFDWLGAAAFGSLCATGAGCFAPLARLAGRVRGRGGECCMDAVFLAGAKLVLPGPVFGMLAGGIGGRA